MRCSIVRKISMLLGIYLAFTLYTNSAVVEASVGIKRENLNRIYLRAEATQNYEKGVQELRGVIQRNSGVASVCSYAQNLIARLYFAQGDYQKAIDEAKVVRAKYPDEGDSFFCGDLIGRAYQKISEWGKAKEMYETLITDLSRTVQQKQNSAEIWSKIIDDKARLSIAYYRLGKCFFEQKEFEEAITTFHNGFGLFSVSNDEWRMHSTMLYEAFIEAQFLLGESYMKLGKETEARVAYQKVVEKYPGYENYLGTKEWIDKAKVRLSALR